MEKWYAAFFKSIYFSTFIYFGFPFMKFSYLYKSTYCWNAFACSELETQTNTTYLIQIQVEIIFFFCITSLKHLLFNAFHNINKQQHFECYYFGKSQQSRKRRRTHVRNWILDTKTREKNYYKERNKRHSDKREADKIEREKDENEKHEKSVTNEKKQISYRIEKMLWWMIYCNFLYISIFGCAHTNSHSGPRLSLLLYIYLYFSHTFIYLY